MQTAAVLRIMVTANTGGAVRGIGQVQTQLSSTQGSANKALGAIKGFAKGAAVATGAGIGYAVKKAADFESQLDALESVADASGKQMNRFRKQAMKAGADTKFSALEAAAAQTELAKGGLKVEQIMRGGLKSALALAAAGEMDLADAAETTVNAMKLFGLRGKDAMKVADTLATAANKTTADVSDFALALKMGGSAAKAAGLTFGETTTALAALAEIGIKGSDAGTSLKSMLTQLAAPTSKQQKLTEKLNLDFFDAKGNMKSLSDISRLLGDRMQGMSKKQQLNTAKTLAGSDGMRALLALYDAGPEKLTRFEKDLGKQGTAADVAAKKQDNLKGKLENLRGSIETAAIAIGTKMLPTLTRAVEKITDIINDPKLTNAQKFDRLAKMAGEAFEKAIPLIADKAAQAAPVVAGAFIKGFLAAGVWGRLAISGFLLAKMGGPPAFLKVGSQAGAAVGTGMATGVATSGLKGRLVGMLKGWGPTLGIALGVAILPDLIRKLKEGGIKGQITIPEGEVETPKNAAGIAQGIIDNAKKGREGLVATRKELARYEADFRRIANAPGKPQSWIDYYSRIADSIRKVGAPIRDKIKDFQAVDARVKQMGGNVARSLRGMENSGSKNFKQLSHQVGVSTREMLRVGGKNSRETREQIHRQFRIAANKVQKAMDDKVISVKTGTERLRELARKELKLYGISAGRVEVVLAKGAGGERRPTQRGAYIGEGKTTGDSVPALLERGEYVLNRNAVKKVGKKSLDRLNYAAAPRFQTGGMIAAANRLDKAQFPYVWGGGHQASPAPFGPMDCSGAVSYVLQHGGHKIPTMVASALMTAGKPGPGPVTVFANQGHTFMRLAGRYFGTSGQNPGGGAGWFSDPGPGYRANFVQRHFDGAMGALFDGLARVQLKGRASVALEAGQGALDRIRSAANASVERAISTMGVGAGDPGDPGPMGGSGVALMKSISASRGWNFADWWALDAAETSHGRNLTNPNSTARLRGQFLSMNYGAYGPGSNPAANPSMDEQIVSMARYIAERYGTPTKAWAFHQAHNYYLRGGLVGMQKGGALARRFAKTLKKVRRGGSPKVRRTAVEQMMERIKGVGLPQGLEKNLKTYSNDAAVFGEMAERAATLTTDDASGNPIGGIVNGKSQIEWLTDQLAALFKWRNAMARAQEILYERRVMVSALLERARERMKVINAQLRKLGHKPKKNKAAIRVLTHEKGALTKIIGDASSGLVGKRSALGTARGSLLENLDTVQGIGSPMGVLKTLPTVGVLGGQILQAQTTLRDLNAPRVTVTDTATGDDSESASLLQELLREANLRTAVSEAQFKVFRDMPQFAAGGIVPGVTGAPTPAVVHAGEGVFTREQMAAMGGTGGVRVIVHGDIVSDRRDPVEVVVGDRRFDVAVERATRGLVRKAARGLPSRGGGLT